MFGSTLIKIHIFFLVGRQISGIFVVVGRVISIVFVANGGHFFWCRSCWCHYRICCCCCCSLITRSIYIAIVIFFLFPLTASRKYSFRFFCGVLFSSLFVSSLHPLSVNRLNYDCYQLVIPVMIHNQKKKHRQNKAKNTAIWLYSI